MTVMVRTLMQWRPSRRLGQPTRKFGNNAANVSFGSLADAPHDTVLCLLCTRKQTVSVS